MPRSLPFETLQALAAARMVRVGLAAPSREATAAVLLYSYITGLVELHSHEPALVAEPTERPEASPVARFLAENGRIPVNLRHRNALLSDFDRLVLRQLDGTRDRDALAGSLGRAVTEEGFPIRDPAGRAITDPQVLRPLLRRSIEPSLWRLAAAALLVG